MTVDVLFCDMCPIEYWKVYVVFDFAFYDLSGPDSQSRLDLKESSKINEIYFI